MADKPLKLDPTISHGLDDRLGATIEERLAANQEPAASADAPLHPERTEPIGDTDAPVTSRDGG
jgi:hypothetical protein